MRVIPQLPPYTILSTRVSPFRLLVVYILSTNTVIHSASIIRGQSSSSHSFLVYMYTCVPRLSNRGGNLLVRPIWRRVQPSFLHVCMAVLSLILGVATNQNILIEQAESSTAASILRNDDPLTQALRNGETLDLAEIARLNRVLSPIHDTSSPGTVSAEVFSDQDDSTTTKLTSTGAPYQDSNHYKGKGKAKASHASSLSVAYGSASEAEAQQHTIRRDALLEMGVWVQDDLISDMPLKDATRAKKRGHLKGRPKHKKPTVDVAQLATRHEKFNNTDPDSAVAITSARNHLGMCCQFAIWLWVLTTLQRSRIYVSAPRNITKMSFAWPKKASSIWLPLSFSPQGFYHVLACMSCCSLSSRLS
jgi:hypothetical protein